MVMVTVAVPWSPSILAHIGNGRAAAFYAACIFDCTLRMYIILRGSVTLLSSPAPRPVPSVFEADPGPDIPPEPVAPAPLCPPGPAPGAPPAGLACTIVGERDVDSCSLS